MSGLPEVTADQSSPVCWLGHVALALVVVGVSLLAGMPADFAYAQRPYLTHDPFYRGETARRSFFDSFALTGEVSYRPAERVGFDDDPGAPSVDPLGLSLRFDYQVARQLDLGAILNASGGQSGRSLSISWVILKYYEMVENADYAFRLAVDPASDGLVGFPQMDAALIATIPARYNIDSNIAVGARRVRMGYDRWVRTREDFSARQDAMQLGSTTSASNTSPFDVVRTRVLGWEVHGMLSYDFLFDLAGSNFFFTAIGEGGEYELFEAPHGAAGDRLSAGAESSGFTTNYQTGVLWVRSGIEYSRPSFRVTPFVSIPILQWSSQDEEALRSRISGGMRLMLR